MTKRVLALVAGIALPTVLLGAGWLAASRREHASVEREQLTVLARTADAVRSAVEESLDELRHREDGRPFYLYNPVFSPPEIAALNDPIAPSPLATPPEDPRIVGFFQIEPGGQVRTPYAMDLEGAETPLSRHIAGIVTAPDLSPIRDLVAEQNPEARPAQHLAWLRPPTVAAKAPPEAEAARPKRVRRSRPMRRTEKANQDTETQGAPGPATKSQDERANATTPESQQPEELAPQGPLTVALNPWSQNVYNDIQAAQAGSQEANMRMQQRRRSAPITRRNTVRWDVMQSRGRAGAAPSGDGPQAASQSTKASAPRPRRKKAQQQPPQPPPSIKQAEVAVDYTPMAYRRAGQYVVLHRLVSHEGVDVVQGAILDRQYLARSWIPALIDRYAIAGVEPLVVDAGIEAPCALRRSLSPALELELCFPPEALHATGEELRNDLLLQVSALAGLMLVVVLAAVSMQRATKRAFELSKQKSAFVSAVSHELRTPLTTIRMHAEMLEQGLVPEKRRPRFFGQLVHEAVRLSHLVENVLELSRLEEGRRELKRRSADLRAAVRETVEGHRHFAKARGFEIRGPDSGDAIEVAFDAQALSQVVLNLLDNAIKYAAGYEPQAVDVEVTIDDLGKNALLTVADQGPGIPDSERERVFERFYRVEAAEQQHAPGTGIGLALVRELVRAHGGSVSAKNARGRSQDSDAPGCMIEVSLPLAHVE